MMGEAARGGGVAGRFSRPRRQVCGGNYCNCIYEMKLCCFFCCSCGDQHDVKTLVKYEVKVYMNY